MTEQAKCQACEGTGHRRVRIGEPLEQCSYCQGVGIDYQQTCIRLENARYELEQECEALKAMLAELEPACSDCRGTLEDGEGSEDGLCVNCAAMRAPGGM